MEIARADDMRAGEGGSPLRTSAFQSVQLEKL
jgi:hypothetical protein